MNLRKYVPDDCPVLARLFYDTVHSVNAKDYTAEQLDVWATGHVDLEQWNRTFLEHYTLVAVENNVTVGFGDIDRTGYLDRLYVHKDYQRMGIASAICAMLEDSVNVTKISVHSSITARPFFEAREYKTVEEQQVMRQGIMLTNFGMEKIKKAHTDFYRI